MTLHLVIVRRSRKFHLYFKQYSTKFINSKNYCQDPRKAKSHYLYMRIQDQPNAQMKHRRNQRLASQLPEIIAPRTACGSDNVVRNVPQWHGNFYWNISPIIFEEFSKHLIYKDVVLCIYLNYRIFTFRLQ